MRSVILCLLLLPTMVAASQPVLTGVERPVVIKASYQTDPAISGPYVVFTDGTIPTADVWYFDARDDSLHAIGTGPGDQLLSDVSGSRIVYTDRVSGTGDIVLYDLATGTTRALTNDVTDQGAPTLSSRLAAWESFGIADRDIVVYDLLLETTTTIGGPADQSAPSASGSKVVYLNDNAVDVYDADAKLASQIYAGPAQSATIDGNHVAVALFNAIDGDVAVFDTLGLQIATLSLAGDQGNPHISGDWVSFEDFSMGVAHVGLWHWTTGDVYFPTPSTSRQQLNVISGNRLVYTDDRSGDLDIYMFEFSVASGGGGPDGALNCSDTTFAAMADFTVVRGGGAPNSGSADFESATKRDVLVCIDTNSVTSAWVTVDKASVATPKDFKSATTHLERRTGVAAGPNNASATLAGNLGSSLHIRILPAATPQQ